MGFLDSIFVMEKEKEVSPSITPTPTNVQPIAVTFNTPSSTSTVSSDVEEYNQHFRKLFKEANLAGPDYNEFEQTKSKLPSLEESVAFQVTYTSLATMGLTMEKLNSSIDTYIRIVEKDKENFEAVLTQSSSVGQNKKIISDNQKLLSDLQSKIEKLKAEIELAENNVLAEENAHAASKNNYMFAYEKFVEMLKTDKQKINLYLK